MKGTDTYRERMAIPADAVFEAALEDVSKTDEPGDYIARARIEKPGNVPVRFEIPYDTSRIVQNHQCGAGSHSSGVRRPLHSRPSAPRTPLSGTSTTAPNGCMRANRACPNERFRCHRGMHALVRAMPCLFR